MVHDAAHAAAPAAAAGCKGYTVIFFSTCNLKIFGFFLKNFFSQFPTFLTVLITSGFFWTFLDFSGFFWIFLDFSGFFWIFLDFFQVSKKILFLGKVFEKKLILIFQLAT